MKPRACCCAFLCAVLLSSTSARAQDLAAAAADYEGSLQRGSLYRRTLGMEAFAATRNALAYKLLVRRYSKPEEPQLHVRYLLASIFAAALEEGEPGCEEVLAGLARRHERPVDGWLHRCVYGLTAKSDAASLRKVAADSREKAHLRAAAILALAGAKDAELVKLVAETLRAKKGLPRKGQERAFVLEACARALIAFQEGGGDALAAAADAVVAQLGAKETSERTRLVVARLLQRVFPADAAVGENETRVRPRFFSVQGTGRNVAYVLDLSDSMLEPLGEAEVAGLREAMPKEAESGTFARNRFEATKLMLARSLRELAPGMSFGIVGFGSVAELITPGMLEVNESNVAKAIKAVNAIVVGAPATDRPHGTLKGWTNLYGGLRLAFKLKKKGAHPADDEYVDEDCFNEGCDTIFLLSDGEPSWSDFEGWDMALPDDVVGDGEGGGATDAAEGEEIQYYGPHFLDRFLYADLRRLNLYRNVQIHSIGIGEADPKILEAVAEIGMGSARMFGGE